MKIWLRPEDVERLRVAQDEGFAHVTVQVRVDRFDDYYKVPCEVRAGIEEITGAGSESSRGER